MEIGKTKPQFYPHNAKNLAQITKKYYSIFDKATDN